jgi:hypothetical protein
LLEGEQLRLALRNYFVEVVLQENVVFVAVDVAEFHGKVFGPGAELFKLMICH